MIRLNKCFISKNSIVVGFALTLFAITSTAMAFAQPPGVVFPDFYPEEFSGVGRIVSIDGDKVVIDDQLYYLSQQVTYHTLSQEYAFKSAVRPGTLVGYVTGSVNQIVSLWFIEK